MRKLVLMVAFALLLGGAAFAQQDMGNLSNTGASYTTGVVEAADASALTLREDSNRVITLLIDKGTVGADHPLVGSRVRVTFHRNEQSQLVAREIQGLPGQEVKPEAVVHTTPVMPTEPKSAPAYAKPAYTPAPTPEPQAAPEPTLPKGGSPLATIGLLGLLALGGGLALRFKS